MAIFNKFQEYQKNIENYVTTKHVTNPISLGDDINPYEQYIPRKLPFINNNIITSNTKNISKKNCPLCALSQDDMNALWYAYAENGNYEDVLTVASTRKLLSFSLNDVKTHFQRHNIIQPPPNKTPNKKTNYTLISELPEEYGAVLDVVYRQKVLKEHQLLDLFWQDNKKKGREALRFLTRKNFLYKYKHEEVNNNYYCYFLNRAGIHYIELQSPETVISNFKPVTKIEDVSKVIIEHDTSSANVFMSMRKAAKDHFFSYNNNQYQAIMRIHNWYGTRNLSLSFKDIIRDKEVKLIPDGFAAMSVFNMDESYLLPFFYEFDRGTRKLEHVSQQITNYIALAASRAALRRFPELSIDHYHPPILFVVRKTQRIEELSELVKEKTISIPENVRPVFLITDENYIINNPWEKGNVRNIWNPSDNSISLFDALMIGSSPLLEAKVLTSESILRIDPKAAKSGWQNK